MFSLINIFWLFSETKYILFWIYLWQLKEYHVPRLVDHFRTHKGKQVISSPVLILKIILLLLSLASGLLFFSFFSILFLIYLAESIIFLRAVILKTAKKPVKTTKALFLLFVSFVLALVFWGYVLFSTAYAAGILWLLTFDILTPLIVSAVVLVFQPFFVFARNNILRKAADKMNGFKNLAVIGITGSYGKTSTKEFLTTILSKKFKVVSTKEHQNSEVGIAKCILKDLNKDHQIFIAEVGAYNKGKVKEVCSILKPKIGIVTGVNEQHLALFGSLDNLLSAEGGRELADALPKDGFLVLNGDNKYCLDLYKRVMNTEKTAAPATAGAGMRSQNLRALLYTTSKGIIDSDIWAEEVSMGEDSISFVLVSKNREMGHLKINVLGKHNVQNLLGAVLIARELGMDIEEIAEACQEIKQKQGGMILEDGKHGISIIDSSYSANPDGVFADLEYLSVFSNKKAIIMPCLIELGPKSAEIHQKIGKKIAEICSLAIITTKDKFEDLRKGAIDAGMKQSNILYCDNPEEISTIVSLFCKSGDAVLLEGRVPAKLIGLLTEKFDV